jgi:gliding motility-associated-like protein
MRKYLAFSAAILICLGGFSQIPTTGLVGFYPFNGNANDESGNGHNGILSGGPVLTFDRCGVANKAYYFDGTDDYINLVANFDYPRRTINLWFYAETIDQTARHIYVSDNPDLINGFSQMKIMTTNGLKEIRSSSGINGPIAEAHAVVKEKEWHMVTLVADEDSARHYLDGKFIGSFKNGTNTSMAGNQSALLGTSRVFDRFYKGRIDDVRIYDRTLGVDEIMRLYLMDCNSIELLGLTEVCAGTNRIKYWVQPVPGYTDYHWEYSGQNVTVDTNLNEAYLSFSPAAVAGTLKVTVSGAGMVTLTDSLHISLNSLPSAPGTINGLAEVCPGENNLQYTVNPVSGADSYIWNYSGDGALFYGSGTSANASFSNHSTDGILTVTASNACGTSNPSGGFSIHINSLPLAGNPIIGLQEVCQNTGNVLYTTSAIEGAASYGWNFSGENVTIQENELGANLYFFDNATSGNLTVYGINACGSGGTSQKFPIIVKNCSETPAALHIPNSFSPNGDGTNDQFVIRGLPENSSLMVFDRSGKKVFASDNYQNDWNGRDMDGNIIETGTYWYVLLVPALKNEYKGFVYLKK